MPKELKSWKLGDAYCGTATEAINFALTLSQTDDAAAIVFLHEWREGNLVDWPDFQFEPQK